MTWYVYLMIYWLQCWCPEICGHYLLCEILFFRLLESLIYLGINLIGWLGYVFWGECYIVGSSYDLICLFKNFRKQSRLCDYWLYVKILVYCLIWFVGYYCCHGLLYSLWYWDSLNISWLIGKLLVGSLSS